MIWEQSLYNLAAEVHPDIRQKWKFLTLFFHLQVDIASSLTADRGIPFF